MSDSPKRPALWKRILDWPLTMLFLASLIAVMVGGGLLSVKVWRWATGYSDTKQRLDQVEKRLWRLEHER